MGTSTALISVEDYLKLNHKPACEYIDGVLRPKPMPTYKHGKMQFRVASLINRPGSLFEAVPEQTVQVREGQYLIPDVAVQRVGEVQQPYPVKPVFLCIEVLSPDDRFSAVLAKCEDYHAWGVAFCWVIDPDNKECWEYHAGGRPNEVGIDGQITAGEIVLTCGELFADF